MGNFNNNRGGGGRDFNRGGFKSRDSRGPVEMHKAVCDKCGKECEVPFRPTSGKPVFCNNCFEGSRDAEPRRYESRGNDRPSNFEDKRSLRSDDLRQMYDAVCDECGNGCKVPFRPSGDKPIYCSNCFGEKKGAGSSERGQNPTSPRSNDQFEALNHKLDKILQLLDPSSTETSNVPEVKEEIILEQEPVEEVVLDEVKAKPAKKASSKKSK